MVGTATDVAVAVADGVTITVDEAFNAAIKSVTSAGSITLSATSQPDLSGVSFNVQGALLRSWLTPGVVGFNFRSANGTDVSGALATADNWIHDNNSASGTSTSMFADGLSTLKWSSGGTYSFSGSTILCGYLDDGANGGNGATVTLSNVPYETYDVIVYCSSDTSNGDFLAKTVNGTTTDYTLEGSKVLIEKTGSDYVWYYYDAAGAPVAMATGSGPSLYIYRKNLQGDITGIYSGTTGTLLVSYVYDAWGKVTATDVAQTTESAEVLTYNPYLYRGYRFDAETGLYYLGSRYYDPEICRWINEDVLVSTGQGIVGYNMFAYCGNNPVFRSDIDGKEWEIIGAGIQIDGSLSWGELSAGAGVEVVICWNIKEAEDLG